MPRKANLVLVELDSEPRVTRGHCLPELPVPAAHHVTSPGRLDAAKGQRKVVYDADKRLGQIQTAAGW